MDEPLQVGRVNCRVGPSTSCMAMNGTPSDAPTSTTLAT